MFQPLELTVTFLMTHSPLLINNIHLSAAGPPESKEKVWYQHDSGRYRRMTEVWIPGLSDGLSALLTQALSPILTDVAVNPWICFSKPTSLTWVNPLITAELVTPQTKLEAQKENGTSNQRQHRQRREEEEERGGVYISRLLRQIEISSAAEMSGRKQVMWYLFDFFVPWTTKTKRQHISVKKGWTKRYQIGSIQASLPHWWRMFGHLQEETDRRCYDDRDEIQKVFAQSVRQWYTENQFTLLVPSFLCNFDGDVRALQPMEQAGFYQGRYLDTALSHLCQKHGKLLLDKKNGRGRFKERTFFLYDL